VVQRQPEDGGQFPPGFDPHEKAQALHDAFDGWGTDERKVLDILWAGSRELTQAIEAAYNQRYHPPLEQALHDELSGDDLQKALQLLGHGKLTLRDKIREAVQGWGTDENKIFNALDRASAAELNQLRNDPELVNWLRNELSGEDLRLVNAYLDGNGVLAAKLRQAIAGWGTDEAAIWRAIESATPEEKQFILSQPKLINDLKADLSESDWIRCDRTLRGTLTNVDRIEMAIAGWGTDEAGLKTALSGLTAQEFSQLPETIDQLLSAELSGSDLVEAQEILHQQRLKYDPEYQQVYFNQQGEALDEDAIADAGNSVLIADDGQSQSAVGRLKAACAGFGTDEKQIWQVLNSLSESERQFIRERNPQGVLDVLRSDLSNADYTRAMELLSGGAGSTVAAIKQAVEGLGTDERLLYDAIDRILNEGVAADILADQNLLQQVRRDISAKQYDIFYDALRIGHFTPLMRLQWATAMAGTDEELVFELCREYGQEWYSQGQIKPAIAAILQRELDTRDYWQALDLIRGEPQTEAERLARAKELLERERGGISTGIMDALSSSGENADDAWREYQATYNNALADGELTEAEQQLLRRDEEFSKRMTAEYRDAKATVAQWASTIAVVIVGIAATILTAGVAGSFVATLAASLGGNVAVAAQAMVLAAALKVGLNKAIQGEGYDVTSTQALVDAVSASVEVGLTMVGGHLATQFMQGVSKKALAQSVAPSVQKVFGQAGTRILNAGLEGSIDATIGGIGEGIIQGMAQDETWAGGVEGFFKNMGTSVGVNALMSGVGGGMAGAGFKSIGEVFGPRLGNRVPETPPGNPDAPPSNLPDSPERTTPTSTGDSVDGEIKPPDSQPEIESPSSTHNVETPTRSGAQVDEPGVVAQQTTPGGHTLKALDDGNVVLCSDCELIEVRYQTLLKNKGNYDAELKGYLELLEADLKAIRQLQTRKQTHLDLSDAEVQQLDLEIKQKLAQVKDNLNDLETQRYNDLNKIEKEQLTTQEEQELAAIQQQRIQSLDTEANLNLTPEQFNHLAGKSAGQPLTEAQLQKLMSHAQLDWKQVKANYLKYPKLMKQLVAYRKREVQTLINKIKQDLIEVEAVFQDKSRISQIAAGSTDLTSDYDIVFYSPNKIKAIEAVERFNEEFREKFGRESGFVFDTNVYTPGFLPDAAYTKEAAVVGKLNQLQDAWNRKINKEAKLEEIEKSLKSLDESELSGRGAADMETNRTELQTKKEQLEDEIAELVEKIPTLKQETRSLCREAGKKPGSLNTPKQVSDKLDQMTAKLDQQYTFEAQRNAPADLDTEAKLAADQDVMALTQQRRNMTDEEWKGFKKDTLNGLDSDPEVQAQTTARFKAAEQVYTQARNDLDAEIIFQNKAKKPDHSDPAQRKVYPEDNVEAIKLQNPNAEMEASNILYVKRLAEVKRILAELEPLREKRITKQLNKTEKARLNELTIAWNKKQSEALIFANEIYYTSGAAQHVVGNQQMFLGQKLTPEEYLNAFNEQISYALQHITPEEGLGDALWTSGKYTDRAARAIDQLTKLEGLLKGSPIPLDQKIQDKVKKLGEMAETMVDLKKDRGKYKNKNLSPEQKAEKALEVAENYQGEYRFQLDSINGLRQELITLSFQVNQQVRKQGLSYKGQNSFNPVTSGQSNAVTSAQTASGSQANLPHSPNHSNTHPANQTVESATDVVPKSSAKVAYADIKERPILDDPYARIRESSRDIDVIANLTGLPKEDVALAKEHFMVDTHVLVDDTTGELYRGRFTPDQLDVIVWGKVVDGQDLSQLEVKHLRDLILHENAEGRYLRAAKKELEKAFNEGKLEDMLRSFLAEEKGMSPAKINLFLENEPHPMTPYRYAHWRAHFGGGPNPKVSTDLVDQLIKEKLINYKDLL
jgi:hypothetical protein